MFETEGAYARLLAESNFYYHEQPEFEVDTNKNDRINIPTNQVVLLNKVDSEYVGSFLPNFGVTFKLTEEQVAKYFKKVVLLKAKSNLGSRKTGSKASIKDRVLTAFIKDRVYPVAEVKNRWVYVWTEQGDKHDFSIHTIHFLMALAEPSDIVE